LFGGVLLDQTGSRRGQLGTILLPVGQTIHGNAQTLFAFGSNRIVETDTFDETAVAAVTGIGNNHVVERALFGAATGKADNNHSDSFVSWKKTQDYIVLSRKNKPLTFGGAIFLNCCLGAKAASGLTRAPIGNDGNAFAYCLF
jgi:hypothetical protein